MNRPCAACDPLPHWFRQLENALKITQAARDEGYGIRVILTVNSKGRIMRPIISLEGGSAE